MEPRTGIFALVIGLALGAGSTGAAEESREDSAEATKFESAGGVLSAARMKRRFAFFAAMLLLGQTVFAFDDAERLSRKVPGQAYRALDDYALLEKGDVRWGIPLWSSTPANLKIIKVLGDRPAAPYAVEITVARNQRIDGSPDTLTRLRSIHFLAVSLEDALKIRRALIVEIELMRRVIEKRQGNPPGYLKRVVESQNR